MDDQFVLRRADISDINALSQLSQKTFRETFVEDLSVNYSEKDLDSYFRSMTSSEWFTKKILDPQRAVWVIEDKIDEEFVAYAVAGLCDNIPHPDICPNTDGALNRLFVRRDRQSHGFGQQLMKVILSRLEQDYPKRPIWLSVFSKNIKAQNFYAHYGFNKVGEYDRSVGETKHLEFILRRQALP